MESNTFLEKQNRVFDFFEDEIISIFSENQLNRVTDLEDRSLVLNAAPQYEDFTSTLLIFASKKRDITQKLEYDAKDHSNFW